MIGRKSLPMYSKVWQKGLVFKWQELPRGWSVINGACLSSLFLNDMSQKAGLFGFLIRVPIFVCIGLSNILHRSAYVLL